MSSQRSSKILALARRAAIAGVGGGIAAVTCWKIWSRNAYFETFTPESDKLFHMPLIKKINPHNNPSIDDSCVYKVPCSRVKQELLEDFRQEGPKLVNAFAQGIWGGYGYAIQRQLENLKTRNDDNRNDMWTQEDCYRGQFAIGDTVTDHLMVIERTSNSIITRGGPPPRSTPPDQPRELDNIGEMRVDLNEKEGVIEFRFKNIFFAGAGGPTDRPLFPGWLSQLHYAYAKLLLHSGVSRCVT